MKTFCKWLWNTDIPLGRLAPYVMGGMIGRWPKKVKPPKPTSAPRRHNFEARCEWAGCGTHSWAVTAEEFIKHTSFSGPSAVKMTKAGLWACRSHAIAVGNGWMVN